eukprot:2928898-Amphidinium_carterae.1
MAQPKRSRIPSLLGEFGSFIQLLSTHEPVLDSKQLLLSELDEVPVGARLLTRDLVSALPLKLILSPENPEKASLLPRLRPPVCYLASSSDDPKKNVSPADNFVALGVHFDFSKALLGELVLVFQTGGAAKIS